MTLFDFMHQHPYVSVVMLLILIDGLRSFGDLLVETATELRYANSNIGLDPPRYAQQYADSTHEFGCNPPIPRRPLIWFKPYAWNRGSERIKQGVHAASSTNAD